MMWPYLIGGQSYVVIKQFLAEKKSPRGRFVDDVCVVGVGRLVC